MLVPEGYKSRLIEKLFDEYMETFGAVCIEGPKYCGKTWTAQSRAESVAFISDPEKNFQTRTMAKLSPDLVLNGQLPRLIDEWQEVPPIWDAVRFAVDKDGKKGKYILTGSATPNHKGIMHSGTARIGRVRMNSMSLYETGDSSGDISLKDLFAEEIEPRCTLSEYLSQSRFKMRLERNERDKTGKAEITRDRANLTGTILRVCDSNNEKNGQNFISVFEVMKNKRIIG